LLLTLVAVDALALLVSLSFAGVSRVLLEDTLALTNLETERHLLVSLLFIPVLLLIYRAVGLYNLDYILIGTREYARIAHATTYGAVLGLAVSYFAGGGPLFSRSWVLMVWALSIICVGLGRFGLRRVVRALRKRGALRTRVVIIGASTFGVDIAERLLAAEEEGSDVVGFLDEYLPLGQPLLGDLTVIGRPDDLVRGAMQGVADEYIMVPQALPHQRLEEITQLMVSSQGPRLRLAVTSSDLLTHGVQLTARGGVPLVSVDSAHITGIEAALKRTLDVVGAALALVLLAPLAVVALARAALAGVRPLIEQESVYGAGGRRISLVVLAPGVSPWLPLRGAPALLAVLAGHLSLVGPRPSLWQPGTPVPAVLWLTAVKPGLTGPWRLSGPEASLADQTMQDVSYVRNYTIWEDVRIIWETFHRLLSQPVEPLLSRWQESHGGTLPTMSDMRLSSGVFIDGPRRQFQNGVSQTGVSQNGASQTSVSQAGMRRHCA
jgi:lipopolysaccharide/colanic/teichoic acid biosynthesis glycosyltransferase